MMLLWQMATSNIDKAIEAYLDKLPPDVRSPTSSSAPLATNHSQAYSSAASPTHSAIFSTAQQVPAPRPATTALGSTLARIKDRKPSASQDINDNDLTMSFTPPCDVISLDAKLSMWHERHAGHGGALLRCCTTLSLTHVDTTENPAHALPIAIANSSETSESVWSCSASISQSLGTHSTASTADEYITASSNFAGTTYIPDPTYAAADHLHGPPCYEPACFVPQINYPEPFSYAHVARTTPYSQEYHQAGSSYRQPFLERYPHPNDSHSMHRHASLPIITSRPSGMRARVVHSKRQQHSHQEWSESHQRQFSSSSTWTSANRSASLTTLQSTSIILREIVLEPAHHNKRPELYKTELCRSYSEFGVCKYGLRCQYAHGLEELLPKGTDAKGLTISIPF